ncbi:hypothetical protein [Roseomonas mucosa]|uniref:hypothetical protein n=1 Tax=Roseomonas mucosa TaxID=207340 RepID=UPI0037C6F327
MPYNPSRLPSLKATLSHIHGDIPLLAAAAPQPTFNLEKLHPGIQPMPDGEFLDLLFVRVAAAPAGKMQGVVQPIPERIGRARSAHIRGGGHPGRYIENE